MSRRPPRSSKDKPRPAAPDADLFQRTMAGVQPIKKKRSLSCEKKSIALINSSTGSLLKFLSGRTESISSPALKVWAKCSHTHYSATYLNSDV